MIPKCIKKRCKKNIFLYRSCSCLLYGAPDWIRTNGLSLRRRSLYPTELRAQIFYNNTAPPFRAVWYILCCIIIFCLYFLRFLRKLYLFLRIYPSFPRFRPLPFRLKLLHLRDVLRFLYALLSYAR